ncbi:uncharacterized protein ASCRUDRAFT_75021 [Ascoidea rubescens DSM 1968]|uniref:PH domain-containing protein n=1 Tax=Ascoidea rubescens DSM 1968 TaxID=1344418 RepID=A0A1D2VJI5_9ASCO|nr:hypothetical protein ASCRUDRAFT_75021 [Ascoidea rubescens DSM 1968]ODV61730.1 hypothetical protein ASCRUDRAFT_75021 [Ascoidea rubescens DSM 1968]
MSLFSRKINQKYNFSSLSDSSATLDSSIRFSTTSSNFSGISTYSINSTTTANQSIVHKSNLFPNSNQNQNQNQNVLLLVSNSKTIDINKDLNFTLALSKNLAIESRKLQVDNFKNLKKINSLKKEVKELKKINETDFSCKIRDLTNSNNNLNLKILNLNTTIDKLTSELSISQDSYILLNSQFNNYKSNTTNNYDELNKKYIALNIENQNLNVKIEDLQNLKRIEKESINIAIIDLEKNVLKLSQQLNLKNNEIQKLNKKLNYYQNDQEFTESLVENYIHQNNLILLNSIDYNQLKQIQYQFQVQLKNLNTPRNLDDEMLLSDNESFKSTNDSEYIGENKYIIESNIINNSSILKSDDSNNNQNNNDIDKINHIDNSDNISNLNAKDLSDINRKSLKMTSKLLDNENSHLKANIKSLEKKLDTISSEYDQLLNSKSLIIEEKDKLSKDLKELTTRFNSLFLRNVTLKNQNKGLNSELIASNCEKNTLSIKNKQLETEIKELSNKFESFKADSDFDLLTKNFIRLEDDYSRLSQKYKSLLKEKTFLELKYGSSENIVGSDISKNSQLSKTSTESDLEALDAFSASFENSNLKNLKSENLLEIILNGRNDSADNAQKIDPIPLPVKNTNNERVELLEFNDSVDDLKTVLNNDDSITIASGISLPKNIKHNSHLGPEEARSLLATMNNESVVSLESNIGSITQTVIGEFLYKYYRTLGPLSVISENRHKRFFWVHPYTLTLYWSDGNPICDDPTNTRVKAIAISGVESVEDNNPLPPGLYHRSIVIYSGYLEIKISCPSKERYNVWLNSLQFLIEKNPNKPKPSTTSGYMNTFKKTRSRSQLLLISRKHLVPLRNNKFNNVLEHIPENEATIKLRRSASYSGMNLNIKSSPKNKSGFF